MSEKTTIEWTDSTWNPITGCTRISPGCKYCYAETFAERWRGIPGHPYEQGFDLRIWQDRLSLPLRWSKPRNIFVNSMSDLFHEQVPTTYILKIINVMKEAYWHKFQVLTKRADRLFSLGINIYWPNNVWLGVSVENRDYLWRIDKLRRIEAMVKFISFEPLLGHIGNFSLKDIDWVIAGGESGVKSRPVQADWVREIRDQCLSSNVPFFFKQWGGPRKKLNGRILDGAVWDEMPQLFVK